MATTGSVEREGQLAVPRDFAFSYVADYRNIPKWMYGVSSIEPYGDKTYGEGALFDTSFTGGVTAITFRLATIDWQDGQLIALKSVRGPDVSARFEFERHDEDKTLFRVGIGYPMLGGLAGRALRKVNDMLVGQAVRHVETNLRREVEAAFVAERRT
ncbi:SRPBCC family protein [Nocardia arizonensis]|nr:SRPBCC family protein [Nocardia arizonensis]